MQPAGSVIRGLGDNALLHAGPPLFDYGEACGALRGSITGAIVHLGLASELNEAEHVAKEGGVHLLSANDFGAGGTYAGVIGRKTPVLVVEDPLGKVRAYAAINEGRGRVLRYGANDPETLRRLAWIEGEFADILGAAIRLAGSIRLFDILAHAIHMGDDGHSRQKAASALFTNLVAPYLAETGFASRSIARALSFLSQNDMFFLPLAMAACKAAMGTADGIPRSTMVTCMAANGVRFGIKVSGLGDWITAPVPEAQGKFFHGYGPQDANPVIGDSEICETVGLGAFAMPAAPALARYVGGNTVEATRMALEMYSIALTEHPRFTIPQLEFRGTPTGIDLRRVLATCRTPLFNTGIAHREPGVGQIGAGFVRTPIECYAKAFEQLTGAAY